MSASQLSSISVISLFPEFIATALDVGVIAKAFGEGKVELNIINPRNFTSDVHQTVDDRPYGGGPGMVMKYQPLADAVAKAKECDPKTKVIYLSPQGEQFTQAVAEQLISDSSITFVCGRYEGVDERFVEEHVDLELSLGDFVMTGGEFAAIAMIDAIVRLLPGTLGDSESSQQDSFSTGLLDHPHYTRPEKINGNPVPAPLLSGNHKHIEDWRLTQAIKRTLQRRPDLLSKKQLSPEEQKILDDIIADCGKISPLDTSG